MPKLSVKRQITIPIAQCNELDLKAGDVIESYVADGKITLIKKISGAAGGLLKDIQPIKVMTDIESLQSALE